MKITELLDISTINVTLQAENKNQVIDELIGLLDQSGKISDPAQFKEAIWTREN